MYLGDILALSQKGPVGKLNYSVELPQANSVERIYNIVIQVGKGLKNKDQLDCLNDVSDRQKDYYVEATIYLGLLTDSSDGLRLSDVGLLFSESEQTEKIEILIRQMFGMHCLKTCFQELVTSGQIPSEREIAAMSSRLQDLIRVDEILGATHRPYSDVTIGRRAEGVHSWLRWIFGQATK
jgi:hypothetical protein